MLKFKINSECLFNFTLFFTCVLKKYVFEVLELRTDLAFQMMNEERVEVELKKMWDDSYPVHSNDIKMASWEKFQSENFSLQKQKRKTLLFWLTFIIKIFTNLVL